MNKFSLVPAILLALALQPAAAATPTSPARIDSVVTKRVASDIEGIDLIISCDRRPVTGDYAAESSSGLPDTDPYVVARGADKGQIHLMNENGRQTKRYIVPRTAIRNIVRVKYDMDVLDYVDLVFTGKKFILVHTATANAGIFTYSEIYELPYLNDGLVDRTLLERKKELMRLLDLGLSFYQTVVLPDQRKSVPPSRRGLDHSLDSGRQ